MSFCVISGYLQKLAASDEEEQFQKSVIAVPSKNSSKKKMLLPFHEKKVLITDYCRIWWQYLAHHES